MSLHCQLYCKLLQIISILFAPLSQLLEHRASALLAESLVTGQSAAQTPPALQKVSKNDYMYLKPFLVLNCSFDAHFWPFLCSDGINFHKFVTDWVFLPNILRLLRGKAKKFNLLLGHLRISGVSSQTYFSKLRIYLIIRFS